MIVEVATVITAIATACAAAYAARSYRQQMIQSGPAIRVHTAARKGDCALIMLSIYPAHSQVVIRRISSDAEGISIAPYVQDTWSGAISYEPAHEHFASVDVDFDLLPAHVSSKSLTLHLSTKLRSSQVSVTIDFHTSRSRLSAKHRITATINNEAD